MRMILNNENGKLSVFTAEGKKIGKIINTTAGECIDNPPIEEPGTFAKIFEGHGDVYHQSDNPPNPFFNRSWGEIFQNPELLPERTKNVFIDQSQPAIEDFRAV